MKLEEFEKAYKLIASYLHRTPLIKNEWLSAKYKANIYLKLENLQPVGSFKLRGAINKLSHLTKEQKENGVFAVSAGNHAQGVAWAAAKFGIKATIIMPKPSPIVKVMNTKALGAKVILEGDTVDETFEFAKKYQEQTKETYIHPFDDDEVIYGQGSIAYEIKSQKEDINFIFGSIGGGGKMAGVGFVAKEIFNDITVVGAQASGANSMINSLQKGKVVEQDLKSTFADGIKVKKVTKRMYELLDNVIDEAISVDDDKIASAVLALMEQARVIAEGAGAINLAAFDLLYEKNPRRFRNKNIVIIICGGNIDINLVDRIIETGLIESNRRIKIGLLLKDKPGALMHLTKAISDTGANVLQVSHDRNVSNIDFNESVVELILETRGQEHVEKIVSTLSDEYEIKLYKKSHS
ncbi:MAG: threonine ammonia-lyase [Bacteriovoracaceae bacterium]|jgi:threonine dehydratase|nr:threonine ammonia-lyase [Bacteriovoracaceae bacterium]